MTEQDVVAKMALTFEIEQQLYRFGRLVDYKRFDELGTVFADDAVGIYNGRQGHDTCRALIESMHQSLGEDSLCGKTQHNVLNISVESRAHGEAESRAYFYAVQQGIRTYEGQYWTTWGEYNDFWTRTDGGWKIVRRLYTTFFSEGPQQIVGNY